MKHHLWLGLGILLLVACTPKTPEVTGTKIKGSEGGTVKADNPDDGELNIDKGSLVKDAIISVGKTTPPAAPADSGIEGGFTALWVKSTGISVKPQPGKQEIELPCNSGIRLKITFPANTPAEKANLLEMFQITRQDGAVFWQALPSKVNMASHYVVGCLNGLPEGESVYTLGVYNRLRMAGGTSQEVVKVDGQLLQKSYTAFRTKYVAPPQIAQQAIVVLPKIEIMGPAGWNNNQPFTYTLNPAQTSALTFSAPTPPVSGDYHYSYNNGQRTYMGTFQINKDLVLARPSNLQLTPNFGETDATFTINWTAPAGADLATQQATVSLLNSSDTTPLDTKSGPSPLVLTVNNFSFSDTYAFCILAWSKNPLTTPFPEQVNEARNCIPFSNNTLTSKLQ
ncbi:hypothetical protein [Deinococcus roseus]|uniref:Fibronectin type-III domain-containing protein n=1 Tax=Deinococcus roseus TaxID=392414 RepID=A0ABQ2CV46_9DEIO|nr:hypothetical protein [Deinococcus roseus]GGJ23801.1 hypothetical protein GCM10008938_07490 [Deinococcus roseus]